MPTLHSPFSAKANPLDGLGGSDIYGGVGWDGSWYGHDPEYLPAWSSGDWKTSQWSSERNLSNDFGLDGLGAGDVTARPQMSYRDSPYADLSLSSFHDKPRPHQRSSLLRTPSEPFSPSNTRTTLWWGDLEPWMDEEYAKQVVALMGWDNNTSGGEGVTVEIPRPPPDPVSGNSANNPGYCYLTFPNSQQAANVLAQLGNPAEKTPTMPNSARPFNLNWAPPMASATAPSPMVHPQNSNGAKPQAAPVKEHSIFVGDLAPEASNSDLLAVFRNPILGLRSDRAPKVVRPFYSCKSAKIMLDPVTGVSKGYGFVRFTDQAEQQRALMEMHGLYCLSRPMRVSPATAKYKPSSPPMPTTIPTSTSNSYMSSLPSLTLDPSITSSDSQSTSNQSFDHGQAPLEDKSVSAPLATATAAKDDASFFTRLMGDQTGQAPAWMDDGWNSPANAQARAILASLTGPNGEQMSSIDPYNTTVFVGGLSPLISEDTLRTFFAPFGDIHYVKVPVGKHCGFVQFVRKADAQRAIDRMQGFPIGGSRIRLSWGRSQYKAAQAVVQQAQQQAHQAAEQAARHQHMQEMKMVVKPQDKQQVTAHLTPEQALQLLQQFGFSQKRHPDEYTPEMPKSMESQKLGGSPAATSFQNPAVSQGTFSKPIAASSFEHHYSRSDDIPASTRTASQQVFYGSGDFGPSPSLPANLKLNTVQARNVSPPTSASQASFQTTDSPYSPFFDQFGSRASYLNVSEMLRKDSQPIPRSNSGLSTHKSELDGSSVSPSSYLTSADAGVILDKETSELTDAMKRLSYGNLAVGTLPEKEEKGSLKGSTSVSPQSLGGN